MLMLSQQNLGWVVPPRSWPDRIWDIVPFIKCTGSVNFACYAFALLLASLLPLAGLADITKMFLLPALMRHRFA